MGFPGGSVVKNLPANVVDVGSIPRSGRSPGEGNGNPLRYSCLGNPMDREPGGLCSPWGCKRVGHDLATKQQQQKFNYTFLSFLFETLKDRHLLVSNLKNYKIFSIY